MAKKVTAKQVSVGMIFQADWIQPIGCSAFIIPTGCQCIITARNWNFGQKL